MFISPRVGSKYTLPYIVIPIKTEVLHQKKYIDDILHEKNSFKDDC